MFKNKIRNPIGVYRYNTAHIVCLRITTHFQNKVYSHTRDRSVPYLRFHQTGLRICMKRK